MLSAATRVRGVGWRPPAMNKLVEFPYLEGQVNHRIRDQYHHEDETGEIGRAHV